MCVCAVMVVCKVYYTALLEAARLHTLPRLIRLFTLLTHILPFPVFLFCSFYFCRETLIRAGFVLLFYQLRFRDDPPLRSQLSLFCMDWRVSVTFPAVPIHPRSLDVKEKKKKKSTFYFSYSIRLMADGDFMQWILYSCWFSLSHFILTL